MNIAIKLPNDLKERTLAFPLLHELVNKLKEGLEEDEILKVHLISLAEGIDVLNLLPFEAFYHELQEDDVKSVFSIHRACSNMKINQLDYFISTTESFVDASIGKNLGAKISIGFAVGKNGWLLEKKITKMAGDHKSNQMFRLIKGVLDEVPPMEKVSSRQLPAIYDDFEENPYIVLNLDIIDGEVNSEWQELVELVVGKKFVLMCAELGLDDQQEFLQEYISKLSRKNTYKAFVYDSNITFAKLISYSAGFVTHDSPLVNIASYCGCTVLFINRKENLSITGPRYFTGEVLSYSKYDPEFRGEQGHNYGRVFDEIVKYIEANTEVKNDSEKAEKETTSD